MTSTCVIREVDIHVISAGMQGPPGPPGPSGGGPGGGGGDGSLHYVAAMPLGGNRVITLDDTGRAIYADQSVGAHLGRVLGISVGAVTGGEAVTIVRTGEMTEPSWSWALNKPVFLAANGMLTQVPPTTGFSLVVGFPVAATKLFISLREPLLLS